ncbi:sulfate adenylyltransferase small subunit, partial [Streptomyces sp. SID11233]|nr:sulfate adenylyltransferase small subunit [Streptomyces sp. SID11233]
MTTTGAVRQAAAGATLSHLDVLESEAVHIFREVAG